MLLTGQRNPERYGDQGGTRAKKGKGLVGGNEEEIAVRLRGEWDSGVRDLKRGEGLLDRLMMSRGEGTVDRMCRKEWL